MPHNYFLNQPVELYLLGVGQKWGLIFLSTTRPMPSSKGK